MLMNGFDHTITYSIVPTTRCVSPLLNFVWVEVLIVFNIVVPTNNTFTTKKVKSYFNVFRYFFKFHSERERSYWVVVFSFRLKVPVTIYCDDEESPDYRDMELITVDKLIPEGEETT